MSSGSPVKARVRVKQVKSKIGSTQPMRRTLKGLGLTRMHKTVELEDTPSIRGMIRKVIHLVEVEEI